MRICFNLFDAHSIFFPGDKFMFGGAEVRATTIASQLAKSNEVSVIIKEHEKPIDTVVNHVKIISHDYYSANNMSFFKKLNYTFAYNLKFKNKISKNLYYKWHPYLKVNADFYAAFEITETTKSLVDFCKTFNKKFLLFTASDGELSFDTEVAKAMNVNKELAKYIIGNSFKVFVQNTYQLNKLAENFKITGIQINNPLPLNIDKSHFKNSDKKYITWIGKSNTVKQPLVFIELAKQFPAEEFFMVMNKNNEEIHKVVVNSLPKNIVFKESLPFEEINQLLNDSKLFINTSLYEGFPNTFLQAGYFSVPVVSLNVNPNYFLDASGGGVLCNGDINQLKDVVKNLYTDKGKYEQMSKSIHSYVISHHNVDSIVNKIIDNINTVSN